MSPNLRVSSSTILRKSSLPRVKLSYLLFVKKGNGRLLLSLVLFSSVICTALSWPSMMVSLSPLPRAEKAAKALLASTLALTDRTTTLEMENKKLTVDVAKLTAELSTAKNSQEALEERNARLDAHASDLSASVQRLNGSLTVANADVARATADASYHQERSVRLEKQVEDFRSEVASAADARKNLDDVNASLQKSLAEARADAAKNEMQLHQVEAKLRLAETQVETVKSIRTTTLVRDQFVACGACKAGCTLGFCAAH